MILGGVLGRIFHVESESEFNKIPNPSTREEMLEKSLAENQESLQELFRNLHRKGDIRQGRGWLRGWLCLAWALSKRLA